MPREKTDKSRTPCPLVLSELSNGYKGQRQDAIPCSSISKGMRRQGHKTTMSSPVPKNAVNMVDLPLHRPSESPIIVMHGLGYLNAERIRFGRVITSVITAKSQRSWGAQPVIASRGPHSLPYTETYVLQHRRQAASSLHSDEVPCGGCSTSIARV